MRCCRIYIGAAMSDRSCDRLQTVAPERKDTANCPRIQEICPKAVPDLGVWTLYKRGSSGTPVYILGSPQVDRFIVIPATAITIINAALLLFDGNHSIENITCIIQQRHARNVDIARLYERLSVNGLIARPRPKHVERGDIESMSLTLLNIDIQPCFRMIACRAKSLVPVLAILSAVLILAGLFVQCFDATYARDALRLMSRSGGIKTDILLYYSFLFCSFFFHELAHGLAATYFGLLPRRLCLGLYLGYLPMIYLRIGGTYTLLEWQRIVVWFAGVWWNFTFASACALLLRVVSFPRGAAHVMFVAIVANYWLGIVNLFPFLPTDGYFILATLTKSVNIRSNAWRQFVRLFKREPSRFTITTVLFLVTTIGTSMIFLFRCVRSIHSVSDVRLWLTVLPIGILIARSTWRMLRGRQLNAAPREVA
jgi:Zn-dependent protease